MKSVPGSPSPASWPAVSLFAGAALFASLFLAWRILAMADYLYPILYEPAGIGAHIDRFGPENRFRQGFEKTSREERQRLFSEIGQAIRMHGEGLESLSYHDAEGNKLGALLRPPEIVHLQDVARLVGRLETAGAAALFLLALQLVMLRRQRRSLPALSRMLMLTAAGVLLGALAILVIGPVKVFYALHHWVFPAEHQWFFFYQDSLMSTMMKAPDFFGYVAAALLSLAVLLLCVMLSAASRYTRSTAR
ncbi:MAG: DUF1461 domain-containing protein [Gammaproteobacteria bacterium]